MQKSSEMRWLFQAQLTIALPEVVVPQVSEGNLQPKASVPLLQQLELGPVVERAWHYHFSCHLSPWECLRNWVRRNRQAKIQNAQLANQQHSVLANADEYLHELEKKDCNQLGTWVCCENLQLWQNDSAQAKDQWKAIRNSQGLGWRGSNATIICRFIALLLFIGT